MGLATLPVICLMGPTAAGKTDLAVELLQHFPLEIISVDSAMVYRGMDIGTAKPSPELLAVAPHHLLDIRDPSEAYSAAQFCQDAERLIGVIRAKQKIPLLVGGTMLYFRALQQGLSLLPAADLGVRTALLAQAQQLGWPALHTQLQQVDPVSAHRIHPHDAQRLQRALEVYLVTGKTLTELCQAKVPTQVTMDCPLLNLALLPADRSVLYQRIALRFQHMLAQGFIDEVAQLRQRGDLMPDLPALRAVGYRQVWAYLAGALSAAEMQEKGIIATRQLAKRQLTWLRTWPGVLSFDCLDSQCWHKVIAKLTALLPRG